MTVSEILTLVNIILTAFTLTVAYFTYRHSREKDFQDKLYQIKIEAFKDINEKCYSAYKKLNINSTPIVQIYDFTEKTDWEIYYKKEVVQMQQIGFDLQNDVYKYTVFIPADIGDKLYFFSDLCMSFVEECIHFDPELLIEKQKILWDSYADLVKTMRKDLMVDVIDYGLFNRIANNH